jgi:hypothetical protein
LTTLNQARVAAYTRFQEQWALTAFATDQFCFDDETLAPEVDPATGKFKPWLRCSVRSLPGGQETLGQRGNRKYRRRAMARVEVYSAPGTGQYDPDLRAQAALDIFEGQYLAGALVYDGSIAEIGEVEKGLWKLSTATVYFDYEQIK